MNIEEMVAELFDVFDENGDGVISRREFIALAEHLLHENGIGFTSDIFNLSLIHISEPTRQYCQSRMPSCA